jgi:anti-sigma-K factor RskA
MNEMSPDTWREELAPYLLGALDPGEAAELERHLAGCEDCRRELDRLRPAALVLPETVERVKPPAGLRARVMGEVRADAAAEQARRAAPGRRGRFWLRPGGLRIAAGVAVFAVLAAVVTGYAIRDGGSGGGATTTFEAGEAPGVTAETVREGESGTLRLANVKQLPPDRVLQAWVQRGTKIESADVLFSPDARGNATAVIKDMNGVNTVMVTAEPSGGSSAPTSKPLISVPVTS